jgi:hypothetical protein
MKQKLFYLIILLAVSSPLFSQVSVIKTIGKNAENYKLGWGVFLNYGIPVSETGNQSIMIELLDLGYFAAKDKTIIDSKGYVSVKAGYRYIFSQESSTGIFIEPQLGYGRVIVTTNPESTYKDGLALAFETGYTLEVGERGNHLNFGIKYENNLPGHALNLQSIGLRFSYSFGMFRRRN